MKIIFELLVVLIVILTAGCSTTSIKEYAQESRTLFERQMEDGKDCSPKQSCLRDILVSKPNLNNHKTKAAYNKEHKVVMKVIQSVKDCKAENSVWNEHGFPSKENCSVLAEKKRKQAIGKGSNSVPKSTGLNIGTGRYNYTGSNILIVEKRRPLVYVYSPYRYSGYSSYYRGRNYYSHRSFSTHRPLSVRSEFGYGRERMHNDFKNAHR